VASLLLGKILHCKGTFEMAQCVIEEKWLAGWIPQSLMILARAPIGPSYATGAAGFGGSKNPKENERLVGI